MLLADVLTCLGMRRGPGENVALLERAARLWEEIPSASGLEPKHLISRATTYRYLGLVCWERGSPDRAVQAAETAIRLCQQLAEEHPDPLYQDGLYYAAAELGGFLIHSGQSEKQVWRRFQDLGIHPDLLGGRRSLDVLLDSLRVERLCVTASAYDQASEPAAGLAAARKAAAILDRYDGQAPLDLTNCLRLTKSSVSVSTVLRRCGATQEALRVVERVNRWLQDLAPEAPEADYFLERSQLWHQIAKARWQLDQAEDTLDAYRHALTAQRQAYALAPAVPVYRQELGRLYIELGRKLCELGRLDEAEACFREREVLWPGKASRQEALRELRKWASQVGAEGKDLSPAQQQEHQRYLELCARLEKGSRIVPPRGEPVPPHARNVDGSRH